MIEAGYRLAGRLCEPWLPRRVLPADLPRGRVLVVAASAGETKAGLAFAEAGGMEGMLLGSGTAAGLRTADLLDRLRPAAVVLVEAELWPNLLGECERRRLPVGCVGARMSERAAARWRRAPEVARRLLRRVRAFAAASREDADRLLLLGAAPESVRVCGWLKWPATPSPEAVAARREESVKEATDGAGPTLVLGSLHPGELTAALRDLAGTPLAAGRARWWIAPRHARALPRLRREAAAAPAGAFLRFEQRFGVLRSWYSAADAALVGGGARGRGVHDLLEPVAAGLRPLFWGRRGDAAGVGAVLCSRGAAIRVDSGAPRIDQALVRCPAEWGALRAAHDGRAAAHAFLRLRGVL